MCQNIWLDQNTTCHRTAHHWLHLKDVVLPYGAQSLWSDQNDKPDCSPIMNF